jgi:hypothetical protein
MMAARTIIAEQDKAVQMGAMVSLVSPQNLYNARRLLTEAAGEKNVDKYFINPSLQPPKPPQPQQPDPNMLMIQSNQQIEQQKRQVEMAKLTQEGQIKQAQMQFEQAKLMREQQFNEIELTYKKEIEGLKAQISQAKNSNDADAKLLVSKVNELELQLKDAQADEKLAMEKYKADLDAETKLTIERMRGQEQVIPVIEQNQSKIEDSINSIAQIITSMNQPKEIVRDEAGDVVGVRNIGTGEMKTIVKDENGLPVGIE